MPSPTNLMRYVTHDSIGFEIPDGWLLRCGLSVRRPAGDHFRSDFAETVVDIREVTSPVRNPGVIWFHEDQMLLILTGIALSQNIPPIEVDQPTNGPLPYRVRNGLHRYYASVAVGFPQIPVKVLPFFDIIAV